MRHCPSSHPEWGRTTDLVAATELLVVKDGVNGAINELVTRRQRGDDLKRATEALAWIKRFERGVEP